MTKLEKEILRHKDLYYEGKPEISDQEFDALEDKLRKKKPNSEVLDMVGIHDDAKDVIEASADILDFYLNKGQVWEFLSMHYAKLYRDTGKRSYLRTSKYAEEKIK